MKYLLSLPENTVKSFSSVSENPDKFFPCSDPAGTKVGSGGGTSWILSECFKKDTQESGAVFSEWLNSEKRIIIHGGGQSRRLPAYGPAGKNFIPAPVFRWERGQKLNQCLLDLQLPLLERLIAAAPKGINTILASGDALILSDILFNELPDADVITLGMSVDPALASNHGVFVCPRKVPDTLSYMLQKPDKKTLKELNINNLFYIDTGIWLLSDKAVELIMKKSGWVSDSIKYADEAPEFYDLYGTFGLSLGNEPGVFDNEISTLSTAVIPVTDGFFYHFGTSSELISSSMQIQNQVVDQRDIWTKNIKPHPSIFTQNCIIETDLDASNENLWIENSFISSSWHLSKSHVITGIPENNWKINLPENICIDIIPVYEDKYCIRAYGINDSFRGSVADAETVYMECSFGAWLEERTLQTAQVAPKAEEDIFEAKLFPVLSIDEINDNLFWWIIEAEKNDEARLKWLNAERLSAADLLNVADLSRLEIQRQGFRIKNIEALYRNYTKSVFFQTDLNYVAKNIKAGTELPAELKENDPYILMQDMMFCSKLQNSPEAATEYSQKAFKILQSAILEPIISNKQMPKSNIYEDQIVWARSPVRIDLAGGWTDTPPNSNMNGGSVVTVSLELNGQPPLQAFIRPSKNRQIILRSIDLGEREVITTFDELNTYNIVGSPFSIPKAALALSGFLPEFCSYKWSSLSEQLDDFGSGIEISFLAAIPKGSGMGTSSVLAATILGAISDFAGLGWDKFEICNRTLALEQLLTTGGGWQDQYGGVVPGLKLLTTSRGWVQTPDIRWLPDYLFTNPEYKDSMLLYYTGITRVAKNILAEIVEGMFLNRSETYRVLKEMKTHAADTFETIQRGRYEAYGRKIARTWQQKNAIDSGTNNEQIQGIIDKIDDYALGYMLPGAGGGGFLYIAAKNPEAAVKIKTILTENPPNKRARFVDMNISQSGLQVSRS